MILIETCPECGNDLTDLVLTTYPPIPQKKCFNCGWSWTGEQEKVVRVPFGGNRMSYSNVEERLLKNYLNSTCVNTVNNLIVDDLID